MATIKRSRQKGFTIVELLVATTIFTVIVLILITSITQISRTRFKGVTNSRSQETARTIVNSISESIQFSGGLVVNDIGVNARTKGFCVDHYRYSYIPANSLPETVYNGTTNHGLVVDDLGTSGCNGSIMPQDLDAALLPNSREMLQAGMRVVCIQIAPQAAGNLYKLHVQLATGTNELFTTQPSPPPSCPAPGLPHTPPAQATCRNTRGSEFCTTTTITNIVQRRVQ